MALNIKDKVTEDLAARVAAVTHETKTMAVRVALQERMLRLSQPTPHQSRPERLRRFLESEAWPQLPPSVRGQKLSRSEKEEILGYGPEGV